MGSRNTVVTPTHLRLSMQRPRSTTPSDDAHSDRVTPPPTAVWLPPHLAVAVRRGGLTETEALERAAWESEVASLMRRHGLDRALASQVLHGQADLHHVLERRACVDYVRQHGDASVFAEAQRDGRPRAFHLGLGAYLEGIVTDDRPYEVVLRCAQGKPHVVHKLRVRAVTEVDAGRRLRRARARTACHDAAPTRPQDRYALSDRRLFRAMEGGEGVRVTWLDGEQLRGLVVAFSRFELSLQTKSIGRVAVLRHAVTQFDVLPEATRAGTRAAR